MDTREKIVIAAARLFQTKGYSATGINDVLAESKAPKGSLYHYFPQGKIQLAIEAVEYSGMALNANVADDLAREKDAVRAFQGVIAGIVKHFSDGSDFLDISLSIISLEAQRESEALREACEAILNERIALCAAKLESSGFTASEARRLGMLIQILIEGAIVITRTSNDPKALKSVSKALPSLLTKPARH